MAFSKLHEKLGFPKLVSSSSRGFDIEDIEYRENGVDGQRISGFGSARLLLGNFKNDEFGAYTRYTYTGEKPCVVLTVNGKTVVVGTDSEAEVKQIYERIYSDLYD